MRRHYLRGPTQRKDTLTALMASGIVAAGVGAVTFYLTRLFLAREPMESAPLPDVPDAGAAAPKLRERETGEDV